MTKPGVRPIRKEDAAPLAKGRKRKQNDDGEAKPKGKAKAKAKAKSLASMGDWQAYASQLEADPPDAPDSDREFENRLMPFKKARGSKFLFVPGQDEFGRPLPTDDMSAFNSKQKYVVQKVIEADDEHKQKYDAAVATRDKGVIRAFVNSLVPKSCTYAWAVQGDTEKSTAESTIEFQEKVWGVHPTILDPAFWGVYYVHSHGQENPSTSHHAPARLVV